MSDDICFLSAVETAQRVARRELSPVELVDALLARIEAVQPKLNAFTVVCAESARERAKRAEAAVMRGEALGPLHGVAFTVKDMIDVAGVPITWGSYMFESRIPAEDALAVARLKQAGAILLGVTTMPECGPKATTDSPLWGVTRNPWNLERTPGGSSGGAAAALASGCGALALGTDRAGSVRIPAACCGVVGLKPSPGVIPDRTTPDLFDTTNVTGPLARSPEDAALAMGVLGGPDPRDPRSYGARHRDYLNEAPAHGAMAGIRLAWMPKVGNAEVDREVRSSCETALSQFAELGAEVQEVEVDLMSSVDMLFTLVGVTLHALYADKLAVYGERIDRSLREAIVQGGKWSGADVAAALVARSELFRTVQTLFERYDLLASPTLTTPAIPVDHYYWDPMVVNGRTLGSARYDWFPYCHPFNHTGHPAISVPCGMSAEGLPIGLQLVTPWHAEASLLRAATELQRVRPWQQHRPDLRFAHSTASNA